MSKKRPARHGRARSLAISAWPLRFKVALAIAIPLLLAATLGGLQVRNDLNEADNSSSSAKQVTVLPPAVDYLTAAERAMVAAQDPTGAERGRPRRRGQGPPGRRRRAGRRPATPPT